MNDHIMWHCRWEVEKRRDGELFDVVRGSGNMLMYGGASALWQRLIGTSVTAFSNANAYLGVGTSATPTVATQTDLLGTNERKAMEATYPLHTDGVDGPDHAQIVFRSEFGSSDANFAWNEWGIFNDASTGRMLNRKVVSLGTKQSPETWTLTVTLSIQ